MARSAGQARWLAVIDIDEFLLLMQTETVTEVLKEYEEHPVLAVNWMCYGSSGRGERPSSQIADFLWRGPEEREVNRHVKCIAAPKRIGRFICAHHCDVPGVDEKRRPVSGSFKPFTGRRLRINHYVVRSRRDFEEVKVPRGRVDGMANDRDEGFFRNHDRNDVFDDEIAWRYAHRLKPKESGSAGAFEWPTEIPSTGLQMPYYSQFGEDFWIVENLPLPDSGVFVDVGAEDGIVGSNSLYFEQRGWAGLIIEPDPRQHCKLAASRKCAIAPCAIGPDSSAVFHLADIPALSGFLRSGGDINLPVKTLGEVLKEAEIGKIDLLSIDTEGTEIDVWRSFDSEVHQPEIVIIEFNTLGLPPKDREVIEELERGPYRVVHRTHANLIFHRISPPDSSAQSVSSRKQPP